MKKEEILFLDQLVKSLVEAEKNLEITYRRKDFENFNKTKKVMFSIQKEISEIIK